jgi:hypothetical protein
MGQLMGVKTPPKTHWVLCFKVRYLKNPTISWKEFTRIFQKMVVESPDPELTVTLLYIAMSWTKNYAN